MHTYSHWRKGKVGSDYLLNNYLCIHTVSNIVLVHSSIHFLQSSTTSTKGIHCELISNKCYWISTRQPAMFINDNKWRTKGNTKSAKYARFTRSKHLIHADGALETSHNRSALSHPSTTSTSVWIHGNSWCEPGAFPAVNSGANISGDDGQCVWPCSYFPNTGSDSSLLVALTAVSCITGPSFVFGRRGGEAEFHSGRPRPGLEQRTMWTAERDPAPRRDGETGLLILKQNVGQSCSWTDIGGRYWPCV